MCQRATGLLLLVAVPALAQVAAPGPAAVRPSWRKVGGVSVDLGLASPATGSVTRVWFSPDGARLFAQTAAGRIFESADLETWTLSTEQTSPPDTRRPAVAGGTRLYAQDASRIYAVGDHLYRTDNGGASWTNLTAFGDSSVIGGGQHDLAISPRDPDLLVLANDYGVWRSADGGLSWSGLNQALPNLPVRRILETPQGVGGTRVAAPGLGLLEAHAGGDTEWRPVLDPQLTGQLLSEATRRKTFSAALGAEITAVGASGDTIYAGASDGRIWISADRGQNWRGPRSGAGMPVENFYVDTQRSQVALAAVGGKGAHVLRTVNTGVTWDDVSANLPDAAAHALAVDRASGAAYVATDAGLFYATVDLDKSSPPSTWVSVSSALPRASALDVKLDPGANQLYVALDGYGVFATMAPHRAAQFRVVNAADFSSRSAAPGSLVSVVGGKVTAAQSGDLKFPVLDASESESQIQVPFEVAVPATGSVSLALESAGKQFSFGVPLQEVSPAIFVDRTGAPMLLDADSGLMFDARNAARSGARIQILATGLGKVRPDWPTGMAAPLQQPPVVRVEVTAFLDRAPVDVLSATLAPGYIGLYLVEIRLPAIVNAGPAELYVSANGQESNRVKIQVQQ